LAASTNGLIEMSQKTRQRPQTPTAGALQPISQGVPSPPDPDLVNLANSTSSPAKLAGTIDPAQVRIPNKDIYAGGLY
jgi:hypothetical protein